MDECECFEKEEDEERTEVVEKADEGQVVTVAVPPLSPDVEKPDSEEEDDAASSPDKKETKEALAAETPDSPMAEIPKIRKLGGDHRLLPLPSPRRRVMWRARERHHQDQLKSVTEVWQNRAVLARKSHRREK